MAAVMQYISFYLEELRYGLDIRIVKEINTNLDLAPVPRTPPHIRGLVNIRGQVVMVADIAIIFGRDPRPITDLSKIIILKTAAEIRTVRSLDDFDCRLFGDKPVAFIVDRIADVIEVPASEIVTPPAHLDQATAKYFSGVVKLNDELQMILSARALLSGL